MTFLIFLGVAGLAWIILRSISGTDPETAAKTAKELQNLKTEVKTLKAESAQREFQSAIKNIKSVLIRKKSETESFRHYANLFQELWHEKKLITKRTMHFSPGGWVGYYCELCPGAGTDYFLVFDDVHRFGKITLNPSDFDSISTVNISAEDYPAGITNLISDHAKRSRSPNAPVQTKTVTVAQKPEQPCHLVWRARSPGGEKSPLLVSREQHQRMLEYQPYTYNELDEVAGILYARTQPATTLESPMDQLRDRMTQIALAIVDAEDVGDGFEREHVLYDAAIFHVRENYGWLWAAACGVGAYQLTTNNLFATNLAIDLSKWMAKNQQTKLSQRMEISISAPLPDEAFVTQAAQILRVTVFQNNFVDFPPEAANATRTLLQSFIDMPTRQSESNQ